MPTLIMSHQYSGDSIRLRNAALERGWAVERMRRWRVEEGQFAGASEPLVLYGSVAFVTIVAEQLSLALLEVPFDWLVGLSEELLGRRVELWTLGRAATCSQPQFVKPVDEKLFVAQVYEDGRGLADAIEKYGEELPVLVADPIEIRQEWRCFVQGRAIQTMAPYVLDGEISGDDRGGWPKSAPSQPRIEAVLGGLLEDERNALPPGLVIDLAVTDQEEIVILEANPAWGSGLYGCDAEQALGTVAACMMPIEQLEQEQLRWVVERS